MSVWKSSFDPIGWNCSIFVMFIFTLLTISFSFQFNHGHPPSLLHLQMQGIKDP